MPTILLIRHGENDFVKKNRLAGRLPGVHLNENGRKQAQKIAEILCEAPLRAIYSSPMERALETALPLAAARRMPVQILDGVNEIDFGEWKGKTLKQLARLKLWKTVQRKPSDMVFPGGESFVYAQQRAVAGIERLREWHDDHAMVAVFSHGDVIKLLMAHYLDMPLDSFQKIAIETTSLSVLGFYKENVRVLTMNYMTGLSFKPPKRTDPAAGGNKRRGRKASSNGG